MYLIRIIIVGDSGVGKTSLLTRFYEDKFVAHQKTTVGVDYRAKEIEVDNEMVKVQVWDTAGQERFRSVTSSFFNKAQGVILAFDVSQATSFQSVPRWIEDVKRDAPSDAEIMLCATKTDLPPELWQVSREEFTLFAAENGLELVESSSSTGQNVTNAFITLSRLILTHERSQLLQMRDSETRESLVVFDLPKKKKSGCCVIS